MKYFLQLETHGDLFRLKEDRQWKRIAYKNINQTFGDDYLTEDSKELANFIQDNSSISIEGKIWVVNPRSLSITDFSVLHKKVLIKRDKFPILPEITQLTSVIKNGDDEKNNTIVLKSDGNFELIENYDNNEDNPNIISRYPVFIGGNEYIGKDASEDHGHVSNVYRSLLSDWYSHLLTNRTNYFSDTIILETVDELKVKINILKERFSN